MIPAVIFLGVLALTGSAVLMRRVNRRDDARNHALWADLTRGDAIVQTAEPAPIRSHRGARQEQAATNLNEEVTINA